MGKKQEEMMDNKMKQNEDIEEKIEGNWKQGEQDKETESLFCPVRSVINWSELLSLFASLMHKKNF